MKATTLSSLKPLHLSLSLSLFFFWQFESYKEERRWWWWWWWWWWRRRWRWLKYKGLILSWFSVDIGFDFELFKLFWADFELFLGCGDDSWVVLSWWLENCLLSSLLSYCDRWEWEGICVKVLFISFPLRIFLPMWGDEICGPRRENFLSSFPLSLFSSLSQRVEKFSTLCFPSSLKSPQPDTVLVSKSPKSNSLYCPSYFFDETYCPSYWVLLNPPKYIAQ